MPAFPATFDLADLDGSNGFHLAGDDGDERFGASIVAVGDVNGDGFDDLAITDGDGNTVWLGQRGPFQPSLPVGASFPFDDRAAGLPDNLTEYDSWIVALGDINGDGFADFDHHAFYVTETYYEYELDSWTETFFYDSAAVQYGGSHITAGKSFGDSGQETVEDFRLAAVGDINGDGFDDVSVDLYHGHSPDRHKVVFGSATGIPDGANGDVPSLTFAGAQTRQVTTAGDFNGDGIDDLVVEAWDYSGGVRGYVIFGRSDLGAGTVDFTTLDGTNGFKVPDAMDARSVGDVNGDGFDDIVVAPRERAPDDPFYIVYGRTDSPAIVDASAVDGTDGFRIFTAGRTVSAAGDINGDGLGDFIVGTDYVVFGRADVGAAGLDASSVDGDNGFRIVATGIDTSDWNAWNISAAGDVNGDGVDDIVIGTPNEDAVHIILGHAATAVNWVGTSARENHGGSPENDVLNGAGGNDYLRGLGGDDLLIGGGGGDLLDGGAGNDTVGFGSTINGATVDLAAGTSTGSTLGNDTLISIENAIGGAGADDLSGTDGDNRIDGGLAADRMVGRLGNDTYVVDNAGDVVVEGLGAGNDAIETTLAAYKLGNDVETLVYVGTGDFIGTGSVGTNLLVGGDGNDTLNGGFRHDTLRGGLGNDTYIVDEDTVEEAADAGFDTVEANYDIVLGDNLEALLFRGTRADVGIGNALANVMTDNGAAGELNGEAGDDRLFGRAGNDILRGGLGNDLLDGGVGDDFMRGSEGSDTYVVDSLGDVVTESHGDGLDTVRSAVSFTLSGGVENLVITTTGAADGTGNNLANTIEGGRGANFLSGLTGDDKLAGGAGNDLLDGGGGADWMQGGTGNDTYSVNDAGDIVDEGTLPGSPAGGGRDAVRSSLQSYTLGATIEDLYLDGITRNNMATGNALNNRLVGQGGNNTLTGLGGADILTGNSGLDTYVFGAGFGRDTITDFAEDGIADHDTIRFEDGLFADFADVQAHATQSGNDVLIAYNVSNRITLSNMQLGDLTADDFLFA